MCGGKVFAAAYSFPNISDSAAHLAAVFILSGGSNDAMLTFCVW